ncbi:MAG TPA: hypothetical protein EYP92_03370 [Candidatus Thioglobus sp.]|nr:hypothetical protein [Candidatus Thioglobus sp.]
MAFTTSNPNFAFGGAANNKDVALKVFAGEVLTAFETKNVFMPLVTNRSISSGKSAQFPVIGNLLTGSSNADREHTPGQDVTADAISSGEQVITINKRKYASVFVDQFDEAMSHYEVRGQYASEIGQNLAKKVDIAITAQLVKCAASATASHKPGQPAFNPKVSLGLTTTAAAKAAFPDKLVEAMFDSQSKFDENDITGERTLVLRPEAYYLLVQSSKAVNRDWTDSNGGIDTGKVFKIAGVPVVMSNNLPTGTWGFMFTPQAVGVVKLMDIKSESNYIPEKLGTLLVSSYAMGEGVLNAACSQQFTTT